MKKLVKKSKIKGVIPVPPSKSYMQRVLLAALLSKKNLKVFNPSSCDDSKTFIEILKKFGFKIKHSKNILEVVYNKNKVPSTINCKESGFCTRVIMLFSSFFGEKIKIDGENTLKRRSFRETLKLIKALGAEVTGGGDFPFIIKGTWKKGIKNLKVDGKDSSQHISGLLFLSPLYYQDLNITVKHLVSKGYIDLTVNVMNKFGINIRKKNNKYHVGGSQKYRRKEIKIEGDWSSAAGLIVTGTLCGSLEIKGIQKESVQPDKNIVELVKSIGGNIRYKNSENLIINKADSLKSFNYDATHTPDLIPVLSILASQCNGVSRIEGINRLENKESNRSEIILKQFGKIGMKIRREDNSFIIKKSKIKGGVIDPFGDHRIVMGAAILGLISEDGVEIINPDCVEKSYMNFWTDFKKIGGNIYE